jgi:hypothetical protein
VNAASEQFDKLSDGEIEKRAGSRGSAAINFAIDRPDRVTIRPCGRV